MEKYTVLTYIIGDYEKLHELNFTPSGNVRYLCVTDNPNLTSNTWEVFYDESLDKEELLPFDRVFNIRYGLFNYADTDICVRVDGSFGIEKPFDSLVQKFIDGDYFACLNIHMGRDNVIDEYAAWCHFRNFDKSEAEKHIDVLENILKYDLKTKGLYEQSFSINRRCEKTNDIDKHMLALITMCGKDGHFTRLDQTIFSAYVNKFLKNEKIMFVDDYFLIENFVSIYSHNSNQKLNCIKKNTPNFFANKEVEIIDLNA